MNVLDLVIQYNITLKKVGNKDGGEHQGPCPGCGGTDRFHVWPEQDENKGTYWCRQCNKAGDLIQFLIDFEGLTYPQAAERVGRPLAEEFQRPRYRPPAVDRTQRWQPAAPSAAPADIWREKAKKFCDWCHENLLHDKKNLQYLAERGIDLAAVRRYQLGYNPGNNGKDLFRPRESWGLQPIIKEDGRKKMLWLPRGIVIPAYDPATQQLARLRVRTASGKPPYFVIPGSGMECMVLKTVTRAAIVIEAELDALAVHQVAGDWITAVALGNSSRKPDPAAHNILSAAAVILLALDFDGAGAAAAKWWQQVYPTARRWPAPVGKDPGESYHAGADLLAWVKAGLPKAWRLGQSNNSRNATRAGKGAVPPKAVEKPSAAVAIPPAVQQLAELMENTPTVIYKTMSQTSIRWPRSWEMANWKLTQKISKLVYFDNTVFNYIERHPLPKITHTNLIR